MEYCTGGELIDRILENGYLSESEARNIMIKIFSAVTHLHEKKITHRDLKPENLLFASNDHESEIKLIDFGLARSFGGSGNNSLTSIVGTPHYVAPEVLSGKYDYRCDYWSLGVILYILLSSIPPFDGDSRE